MPTLRQPWVLAKFHTKYIHVCILSINSPTSWSSQKSVVEVKPKTSYKICDTNSSNSSESAAVSEVKQAQSACWIWFRSTGLQPVMAITASVQPESGQIIYAWSDFPHPIQFCFSKEGMDHSVQNRPWSDVDGLVRVWPNVSGLEASQWVGIIGPGFWQDGSLPVSPLWLSCILPQTSQFMLC